MGKRMGHLKTIIKHRRYVRRACFKMGLYYQGLVHDLSKFNLKELLPSFKYYTGTSSPIDLEKKNKGYSYAWQHHHNKNPHHWEYWVDWKVTDSLEQDSFNKTMTKKVSIIYGVKIPFKYVLELVCDFIGAGQAYSGKKWNNTYPLNYYLETIDRRVIHNDSKELMLFIFKQIARKDFNYKKTLKQIRKNKKRLKCIYESHTEKIYNLI